MPGPRMLFVFSLLFGTAGVLFLAAAIVVHADPLLFFSKTATVRQPMFYLKEEGNFSRYVFTGLMRNLDYGILWVGPSYAAPFVRTADPRDELMVTMGDMSGWELLAVLRLENQLRKARIINVVISPRHWTGAFAANHVNASFPTHLWGAWGTLSYLFDPYMIRLSLASPAPADGATTDLDSPTMRQRINEAYFWMRDDRKAQQEYWTTYHSRTETLAQLQQLRSNLTPNPPLDDRARWTPSPDEEQLLRGLFAEINLLRSHAKINLIFPPRHISSFGTDRETFTRCAEIKRRILEFAGTSPNIPAFDFEADASLTFDRTRYYDSGHFTDREIRKLRAEIFSGIPVSRDLDRLFAIIRSTGAGDDTLLVKEINE